MSKERSRKSIPALKVRQWLPAWDDFEYDAAAAQAKPEPYFYGHLKIWTWVKTSNFPSLHSAAWIVAGRPICSGRLTLRPRR